IVDFCLRWGAPTGIVMFALLVVQADTGWLTLYRRDATVRSVGVGWRELAGEIDAIRKRTGATCVLVPDYGTTSWLAFYLPPGSCLAQPIQRSRWVNMHERDAAQLAGPLLYVDDANPRAKLLLKDRFGAIEEIAELPRKRGPLTIETYTISLL